MLVLSLPIPIIAGNFEDFHRMQQTKTKAEKAKKKLTEAKANEEAERVAFCKAEVTMKTNSDNVSIQTSYLSFFLHRDFLHTDFSPHKFRTKAA